MHFLTLFSNGVGERGAKERFVLQSGEGDAAKTARVEFDGTQGDVIVQFAFVGNVSLLVEQTAGGMGSSTPGANLGALFLD